MEKTMTANQNKALAASVQKVRNQMAKPWYFGLQARDKASAEEYEKKCKELEARLKTLDDLATRYQGALDTVANIPEDVKKELEARAADVKRLTGEVEELQQKLIEGVHERQADPNTVAAILIRNKNIADQAATIQRSKGKFQFDDLKARNIVTLAGIGGKDAQLAQNDLNRTIERPLTVLDLISFNAITAEWIPLFRESGYDIMADLVDEGEEKPESDLEFGTVDLKAGTIAHWIKVSKQLISDMPALAAYIEGRLVYGVRLKLEYKIINGDGKTTGPRSFIGLLETGTHIVVTPAPNDTAIDVVSKGKSKAGLSGILPEVVILNPEDWGAIERIKGNDGHYIFGAPGAAVQPVLWGLPVVLSAAMPRNKFWTGNLTLGVSGYIREDVSTEMSTEDADNFTKNLCTILSEMRAAFGVAIPDACAAGTLPAVVDAPDAPVVTNNDASDLTGTSENGAVIKLYNASGTVIDVTMANGSGQWTFTPNPLGVGVAGKLTASDSAGNESDPTSVVGEA